MFRRIERARPNSLLKNLIQEAFCIGRPPALPTHEK
jgi:hypothetical protein